MPDITILDMREGGRQRLTPATTTLPLGSTRYPLFNSIDAFGVNKLLDTPVKRISVTIYHDQSGHLDASRSIDGGVTWRVYSRTSVSAPAANNITGAYHYVVEHYANWKLEWVNGGTNQTVFEPELIAYEQILPAET